MLSVRCKKTHALHYMYATRHGLLNMKGFQQRLRFHNIFFFLLKINKIVSSLQLFKIKVTRNDDDAMHCLKTKTANITEILNNLLMLLISWSSVYGFNTSWNEKLQWLLTRLECFTLRIHSRFHTIKIAILPSGLSVPELNIYRCLTLSEK